MAGYVMEWSISGEESRKFTDPIFRELFTALHVYPTTALLDYLPEQDPEDLKKSPVGR